ncbi:hypothetical protein ACTFIZ_000739 [Dictyostelium cf. discoideum]
MLNKSSLFLAAVAFSNAALSQTVFSVSGCTGVTSVNDGGSCQAICNTYVQINQEDNKNVFDVLAFTDSGCKTAATTPEYSLDCSKVEPLKIGDYTITCPAASTASASTAGASTAGASTGSSTAGANTTTTAAATTDGNTSSATTIASSILIMAGIIKKDGEKKRVLIVGCGFGGSQVAKLLDSKFEVTVVERKKTFFNSIASIRAIVEPELAKKIYIPYDKLLKNGKFIYGTVIEISPTLVKLEDGQELTFDYLVIATGSNSLAPFKAPLEKITGNEILNYYKDISEQIKQAKSILIVGGGSVACEVVGEIIDKYPPPIENKELAKKITIVHSGNKLVSPKTNNKFNDSINNYMKKGNVSIILNDRIEIPDDIKQCFINQRSPNFQVSLKTYKTKNGLSIESDFVIWTVGIKLNNESYKSNFSNEINEIGQIKVNQSCQVQGYDNIFAIGDITDFDELKTSYNAISHGNIVAKVIKDLSNGQKNKNQLSKHKLPGPIIGLSLGPKDGITQINSNLNFGSFITRILKSNNLLINRFQKHFNNPEPLKL